MTVVKDSDLAPKEGFDPDAQRILQQDLRVDALSMSVAWAISLCTRLQGKEIDRLRLHDAINQKQIELSLLASLELSQPEVDDEKVPLPQNVWQEALKAVALTAGLEAVEFLDEPDPARLPVLTWVEGIGWGVVRALTPQNSWFVEVDGKALQAQANKPLPCARLTAKRETAGATKKAAYRLFLDQLRDQKKIFTEASVASVLMNLLALFTSLYSMQVYDRVIPTQGYSTLLVLTLGVTLALLFDIVIKVARSHLLEHATKEMDSNLSRAIFSRLLNVRMDQLPSSVGSLSAQLRGYETIRSFLSTATFYLFIDLPFGILFIIMIALIGSPIAALVPLFFLLLAVAFGVVMRGKIDEHAKQGTAATNQKTGLLVEAIEGAETIKSGAGNWNVLSKWIDTNNEAMFHEMALKRISDKSAYVSGFLQQASYIALIGVGGYLAAEGHLTMGALIACSILSGRALAPVGQIPGLIVQGAHSRAALELLEKVYELESDNHDIKRPLIPAKLDGAYELERVRFSYSSSPKALTVKQLSIKPGEKIGIIGPIGSGKSTLLRLLSGMYRPNEGRVVLDGLDIDQLSRHFLGEKIGYLQQDHRLFSGTLRENLLIGVVDPGDDVIKQAAQKTGLLTVIANHPKGLDLIIAEGGKGLSGGQRQLVALTRLLISHPYIWLLDEPTASMDSGTEQLCLNTLKESIRPENTLVLVTHKPNLLALVDRLIIVANHQIVMDGPRDEILRKLSNPPAAASEVKNTQTTSQSTGADVGTSNTKTSEHEGAV